MSDINADLASAVGEQLAAQMKEQEAQEASFRKQQEATYSQVKSARDAMMESFLGKQQQQKGPEYPAEVVEIANALTAQPRLIVPTQLFLAKLVASINEAVDSAVSEVLGQQTGS